VELVEGSWDVESGMFDLVLSNPPYIQAADVPGLSLEVVDHDPHLALTPGEDGLAAYRAMFGRVDSLLRPGGWIGFEFGMGQAADVAGLMRGAGLDEIAVFHDLAGIARAAFGRRPAKAL
jgi:release factor glutamine methyltransferase